VTQSLCAPDSHLRQGYIFFSKGSMLLHRISPRDTIFGLKAKSCLHTKLPPSSASGTTGRRCDPQDSCRIWHPDWQFCTAATSSACNVVFLGGGLRSSSFIIISHHHLSSSSHCPFDRGRALLLVLCAGMPAGTQAGTLSGLHPLRQPPQGAPNSVAACCCPGWHAQNNSRLVLAFRLFSEMGSQHPGGPRDSSSVC